MQLTDGLHLAYCTNIHRGETWPETFAALNKHTLAVRRQVAPGAPYAIGLRLSDEASRELARPEALQAFRHWLREHECYVFTINGFPYGKFHGTRVKEQVYAPDWTSEDRLNFTNRLFDILAQLVPEGVEGSVSTVPCSFKEFIKDEEQVAVMRANLWRCVEHIAALSHRTGRKLHLGLEPEPLCYLETTEEAICFYRSMQAERPKDTRLQDHLGVNYDTCHLAIEFEDARESIARLRANGVKISKIHVSSALKVRPTPNARAALAAFAEGVYFHQVIESDGTGGLRRYRDLDVALREAAVGPPGESADWRIHFHIPLHAPATPLFGNTSDHVLSVFDLLREEPSLCSHLEMETYTWEVMPPEMKKPDVVDQLAAEYQWTLARLAERGIHPQPSSPQGGTG